MANKTPPVKEMKEEVPSGEGGNLGIILVGVYEPFFFKSTPIKYLVFEKNNLT